MLNSDGSGDIKSTDKWKKVWSDFKNNTKKKAARLHKAASGTGGGPAVFSKLSSLEERVLNLIGVQAATGLDVEEAGIPEIIHIEPAVIETAERSQVALTGGSQSEENTELWNLPGPSHRPHVAPPPPTACVASSPHIHVQDVTEGLESVEDPSHPQAAASMPELQPAQSGRTGIQASPQRRIRVSPRRLLRGSPLRSMRPSPQRLPRSRRQHQQTRAEDAAQHFLRCDTQWREFRMQQHRDAMDMRREQNRIREMELQVQREWQALGLRALDLLDRLVSKYCNDLS